MFLIGCEIRTVTEAFGVSPVAANPIAALVDCLVFICRPSFLFCIDVLVFFPLSDHDFIMSVSLAHF